jgi:hypothetical protein
MEFITGLLSLFLLVPAPAGYVLDRLAEDQIRSRIHRAEQLQVRIDNRPNYQIVQGRVDRLQIASRGLWLTPDLRLQLAELETGAIEVDLAQLRSADPRSALRRPLSAGIRLVLDEADLQRALRSPMVQNLIQNLAGPFLNRETVQLVPEVDILSDRRLQIRIQVVSPNQPPINLVFESALGIKDNRDLQLIDPRLEINGAALPSSATNALVSFGLSRFNLNSLAEQGIGVQILQLNLEQEQLNLAFLVRLNPVNVN